MIEISHLSKRYGALTAVDDISFNVQPGEVLGFLGPNGAGKSTTMKMITGFLAPTSGSVRVCGHDVRERSRSPPRPAWAICPRARRATAKCRCAAFSNSSPTCAA